MDYKPLYENDYFRKLLNQLETFERKKKQKNNRFSEKPGEKEAEK